MADLSECRKKTFPGERNTEGPRKPCRTPIVTIAGVVRDCTLSLDSVFHPIKGLYPILFPSYCQNGDAHIPLFSPPSELSRRRAMEKGRCPFVRPGPKMASPRGESKKGMWGRKGRTPGKGFSPFPGSPWKRGKERWDLRVGCMRTHSGKRRKEKRSRWNRIKPVRAFPADAP
jgi:hypothetical protein